jgi:hypothetical protein
VLRYFCFKNKKLGFMMDEEFLTEKQIIEIDLFILKTLKEILLNKNF